MSVLKLESLIKFAMNTDFLTETKKKLWNQLFCGGGGKKNKVITDKILMEAR